MNINATVALEQGETATMTADEAATAILQALNGDPAKDTCWVNLSQPPIQGSAGAVPPIVEPPTPDPPPVR